jgi:hypothetical protein
VFAGGTSGDQRNLVTNSVTAQTIENIIVSGVEIDIAEIFKNLKIIVIFLP